MADVQSIYRRKQHGLVNMDREVSQEETIAQLQRSQVVRDVEEIFQTMIDANCQLGFKAPQSMFGSLKAASSAPSISILIKSILVRLFVFTKSSTEIEATLVSVAPAFLPASLVAGPFSL